MHANAEASARIAIEISLVTVTGLMAARGVSSTIFHVATGPSLEHHACALRAGLPRPLGLTP